MHVKEETPKVMGVVVRLGRFLRRRKRAAIALLVIAPLLLTGDGEVFVLNAVGLGFGALLLRRFARPRGRRRTGRARQAQRKDGTQRTARTQEHEGGHDDDASDDDWWDWDKATRQPGGAGGPADGGAVQG